VPDIALVSLGTTPGLRRADDAFVATARAAGVSCELVQATPGRGEVLRRHPLATDLVEALWARNAGRIAPQRRATVFSTVTAALLQPLPQDYAVRFDAPAALNRPGVKGLWQRPRERKVLAGARVLLPWGQAAAAAIPAAAGAPVVVLHVPIPDVEPAGERDIAALMYAGYPMKRGLDTALAAWRFAAGPGERLVVTGIGRAEAEVWLRRHGHGIAIPEGVEWTGRVEPGEFTDLLERTRVFVNASRHEDHGLSQLEALSAGAVLVTVPSPGPYEALPLARELAPALVSDRLPEALRAGLDMDDAARADYARRAAELLAPYRPDAVTAVFRERVVPALGLA